ncbi:MAG: S8 family serine peptidase [Flavobacteriales bacterium]|nr:S8 family serine peptidase [Flavobacteriales bacterium]
MKNRLFFTFLLIYSISLGQNLKLKSGTYSFQELEDIRENYNSETQQYAIVSFHNTPTTAEKEKLKSAGIELHGYLPEKSFYALIKAGVNFSSFNQIAQVSAIRNEFKLAKNLSEGIYPAHAISENDQVDLICNYFSGVEVQSLFGEELNVIILESSPSLNQLTIRVQLSKLNELYSINELFYFEPTSEEGQPENKVGRTDHRSNFLRSDNANGLFYRGEGVTVMMQDDGYIGDHIDYEGRIDQSGCLGCSSDDADNHGDHVAGTIMGAGNLDPSTRGMADGVNLLVYSSANTNYNLIPSLYANDSLVVTSKSYSNGCNGGYTSLAAQLDQQIRQMPALTHVFSAGNSGTEDCGYGAGAGWGNITGGHKVGKNVFCVGNLTRYDVIASSSSRGPAEDGRIKPDICGVGSSVYSTISDNSYENKTGTSMSCPGVAGTIAQLYEAYRSDYGVNPLSGLIKASILNTGEDLGNKGPDFIHGWGRINARRAYETFNKNLFIYDSISQGSLNTHIVSVPAEVKELRVMVYWVDYEGSTSSSTALVNDINMVVSDPSAVDYLPWVLDPTPTVASLNALAVPGIDNLNNMEQVTILNPTSGNHTITIDGFNIPQGPQSYHIVYYFIKDEVNITYPNGGEPFEPSTSEIIRWDAPESPEDFVLEYTTDNGLLWNPMVTVNANKLFHNWSVPDSLSGLVKVRVTRGLISDESDEVFSIIDVPNNLDFAWACPDSTKIIWDSVPGAILYEVSMLGSKYMDSIGVSATNYFTIMQPSTNTGWYSVKAIGPDNAISERHFAIQKTGVEFECLWSTPTALFSVDCEDAGTGHCLTFDNQSINADATSSYSWYFPNGTPSFSSDQNPQVCYSAAGDYDVALVVDNGFDVDSVYLTDRIHISAASAIPYFEGFENYSSLTNIDEWSVVNSGFNQAWMINTQAALSGNQSARLLNYTQSGGNIDELISGPVDLSTLDASASMTLSFRYSYRKKISGNDEWLRVYARENCSENWLLRKSLHGSFLSDQTSPASWTPSIEEDWTTVHMTNITNAFFSDDFRFKFTFESDGGNSIYIDDINIYEGAPSDTLITSGIIENSMEQVQIYPNPATKELNISYNLTSNQFTNVVIRDLTGKLIKEVFVNSQSGKNLITIDVSKFDAGVYLIETGGLNPERIVIR